MACAALPLNHEDVKSFTPVLAGLLGAGLLFAASEAAAQTAPYLVHFSFRGFCYQTNGLGETVATPITEQTLLADRAAAGGITDLSTVAMAYHFWGDPKGDTVAVVNATNGQQLTLEFGLWFGADATLGRSSLTNVSNTQVRSVDYVYTLDNSTYTSANSHSMGAAFVTRRFMKDINGNPRYTAEGPLHWIVNPTATTSTKVISGTFTTTTPLF